MTLAALIDSHELQQAINSQADELIIVDLSSAEQYAQAHIPGAIHIAPSQLSSGQKPAPGSLPSHQALQQLLQSIGLASDKHVVCYDDAGSSWAGRMIWTLDVVQHSRASLLDGGLAAWQQAGGAVEATANTANSDYTLGDLNAELIADKAYINANLSHIKVWDARSAAEYSGEKVLAARGGHIPGATHCEWTDLHGENGKLKPLDEIKNLMTAKGFSGADEIITHCQTHRRSGLTYFVAKKLLGYNIKAYPGSWSEWGNDDSLPVE